MLAAIPTGKRARRVLRFTGTDAPSQAKCDRTDGAQFPEAGCPRHDAAIYAARYSQHA